MIEGTWVHRFISLKLHFAGPNLAEQGAQLFVAMCVDVSKLRICDTSLVAKCFVNRQGGARTPQRAKPLKFQWFYDTFVQNH